MNNADNPAPNDQSRPLGEPRRSRLRRILDERPDARPRLARAVAELLGISLVVMVALGALLIWHVVRRGRIIRERLGSPRLVELPELPSRGVDESS
jgi:hypothetical protein